jgi:uncharacterized protein YjbI with pentapeptide repeats
MGKLSLLLFCFLALTSAHAAGPASHCPALTPSKDETKWVWMDGSCHLRTGKELVHILVNHKLWLRKYAAYLGDEKTLETHGALSDPLRADLSNSQLRQSDLRDADLVFANFSRVDFTGAVLSSADLTGADLEGSDFTGANLIGANLTGADLECANPGDPNSMCTFLGGADLTDADLTGADLSGSDLTGAKLNGTDLTCGRQAKRKQICATLENTDLSGADLEIAELAGADLNNAVLHGANLNKADLSGANLSGVDFTSATAVQTDLSSAILQRTDFSNADLTLAKLWYADFEPKAPPLHGTIPAGEGLETVRWFSPLNFNNELYYRLRVEQANKSNGLVAIPRVPPMQDRWLVWLSCRRERMVSEKHNWIWRPVKDVFYLVSDVLLGLRPSEPQECASLAHVETGQRYQDSQPTVPFQGATDEDPVSTLAGYQLIDIRTAAQGTSHQDVALEVNLAIQRHTQSQLKMIAFDWTCAYGTAPARPFIFAGLLAAIALPFYWVGFRRQRHGVCLLRVGQQIGKDDEILQGDPLKRPRWATPPEVNPAPKSTPWLRLLTRLHLNHPYICSRLYFVCRWPRVRWEASFLKAVVLFSLISVIDLGFEGLDFGRWVRMLFFTEYDLKARGWLRLVSGLQSIVGLGLLALSLLSFFGHLFE